MKFITKTRLTNGRKVKEVIYKSLSLIKCDITYKKKETRRHMNYESVKDEYSMMNTATSGY